MKKYLMRNSKKNISINERITDSEKNIMDLH